ERPLAERSAGRGQDHAPDGSLRCTADALEDCAVLAVHRHELAAAATQRCAHQRPTRNERFLVGESEPFSGVECGERRLETGCTHYRVDDDVRLRMRCRIEQRSAAGANARMQWTV